MWWVQKYAVNTSDANSSWFLNQRTQVRSRMGPWTLQLQWELPMVLSVTFHSFICGHELDVGKSSTQSFSTELSHGCRSPCYRGANFHQQQQTSFSFFLARDKRRGFPRKRERGTCRLGGRHVGRAMDGTGWDAGTVNRVCQLNCLPAVRSCALIMPFESWLL